MGTQNNRVNEKFYFTKIYVVVTQKNHLNEQNYFSTKTYVLGTQKNRLNETVLLSTLNICSIG